MDQHSYAKTTDIDETYLEIKPGQFASNNSRLTQNLEKQKDTKNTLDRSYPSNTTPEVSANQAA